MAEMFWDRARVDPYVPPIFAAPRPPPLPLAALPQGHPWWMPPPMFPPADAAAGPMAPASLPLPPLANVYPWGNAPLIFSPGTADAAGQPVAAPSSLPGAMIPIATAPQPPMMPATAASQNGGSGAAAIAPPTVTGSAPAPKAVDPVASAPQPSPPGSAVKRRQGDWSDVDRARLAGVMKEDFHRHLLSKYPDLPPPPYSPSFGELRPAQFTPTQQVGNAAAEGLMALGVQPYTAFDLTHRVGNLLSAFPPTGIPGAAADTLYAQAHHDRIGALLGMAAMLPGAGPEAGAVEGEIRSATNAVRERVAGAVHDVGSALKAEAPASAPVLGASAPSVPGLIPGAAADVRSVAPVSRVEATAAGSPTVPADATKAAADQAAAKQLPVHDIDPAEMPNIAAHIARAIAEGKPDVLTRQISKKAKTANREAALDGLPDLEDTHSWDEYPYASVQEGGKGASTAAVPRTEQNIQGWRLAQFYRKHNIGHGDQFRIRVLSKPPEEP